MRKIIKKIGKSTAILFTSEEQKVYGLKVGKIYDIEIVEVKNDIIK